MHLAALYENVLLFWERHQIISAKSVFSKSMLLSINNILSFLLVFTNTVILGSTHFRLWTSIRHRARRIQAMSGPDRRPELPGLFCVSFKYCFIMKFFSSPWRSPGFPGLLKASFNDKLLPAHRKFWGADTFSDVRMSGICGCCSEHFGIPTLPPHQWLHLLLLPDAELRQSLKFPKQVHCKPFVWFILCIGKNPGQTWVKTEAES